MKENKAEWWRVGRPNGNLWLWKTIRRRGLGPQWAARQPGGQLRERRAGRLADTTRSPAFLISPEGKAGGRADLTRPAGSQAVSGQGEASGLSVEFVCVYFQGAGLVLELPTVSKHRSHRVTAGDTGNTGALPRHINAVTPQRCMPEGA